MEQILGILERSSMPLQYNCTIDLNRKEARTVGSYQYRVHEYCANIMPYVRYMQNQRRINQVVDTMRKTESEVKNTLSQYQDDFLMFGKYSINSLKTVIDTLNSLHDKQTELQKLVTTKLFTEVKHAGDALDYSVEMQLFPELAKEEHVTKYKEVDKAGRELLDVIAILSQRRLPRSLFPDQRF